MKNTLLFFFLLYTTYLQSQQILQDIAYGDSLQSKGQNIGAVNYWNELMKEYPYLIELHYKKAEALRLSHQYNKAQKSYEYCYTKQLGQYPLAVFHSAEMLKMEGLYNEALKEFRFFYKEFRNIPYYSEKAKQELFSCNYAMKNNYTSSRLDLLEINSNYFEYCYIPLASNQFAYTSIKPFLYDSATVRLYSNSTSPLLDSLQTWLTKTDLSISSFSVKNSDECYTSICFDSETGKKCNPYYISILNDEFKTMPVRIDKFENNAITPHYTVINEKGILLFSAGGDIYKSEIFQDQAEAPEKIASINSNGEEICPFFWNKENILFFSSNWHTGFGGFDVFYSKYSNGIFSAPVNCGTEINSSYNDLYFTIFNNQLYLTSNRDSSKVYEIFYFDNDFYTGSTDLLKLNSPTQNVYFASIYFDNDIPSNNETQLYYSYLERYRGELKTYKKLYLKGKSGNTKKYAKQEFDYFLINDIELGYTAFKESLLNTKNHLELKGNVEITLVGYTSFCASEEYNMELAKKRIASVKKEILSFLGTNTHNVAFIEIPLGEQRKDVGISGEIAENEMQVFSPRTLFERRVEVTIELLP